MPDIPIKIALVDDDVLVVKLLEQYLSLSGDFEVTLTAYDGSEFLEKLRQNGSIPDIALIDLRMEHMDGIETVGILKADFSTIKVITLSSHYKPSFLGYMLKVGVNAFIPKDVTPQDLYKVIYEVQKNGCYFNQEQLESLRSQIAPNVPQPRFKSEETLTTREIEVLELICNQYSTAEIAEKLFITKRTVEGHRNNLFVKTGTKNVAGLVVYALQKEIINLNDFIFE